MLRQLHSFSIRKKGSEKAEHLKKVQIAEIHNFIAGKKFMNVSKEAEHFDNKVVKKCKNCRTIWMLKNVQGDKWMILILVVKKCQRLKSCSDINSIAIKVVQS